MGDLPVYKSRYWLSSFLALLLLIVFFLFQWHQHTRLETLFSGPYQICQQEKPSFYHQVNYNTVEYAAGKEKSDANQSKFTLIPYQDEIPEIDGNGRDEINEAMQKRSANDSESLDLALLRYQSVYKDRHPYKQLQIISPENQSVFPPNLCAPYVTWEDPNNQAWQVVLEIPGKEKPYTFITKAKEWRFPKKLWNTITKEIVNQDILLYIRGIRFDKNGEKTGMTQCSEPVHFRIAEDPADNYIVYRQVTPPFNTFKTPNIYIRDIRRDTPELFLSSRKGYCINCHAFSSKNGKTCKLSLQVRSLLKTENNLRTYLAVYDFNQHAGSKIRLPFELQMSTFMAWSPDEKKLAFSANQNLATLKPMVYETNLAGMATSDIAIYDTEKRETYLVPGASDPNMLEIYPQWTPDGKQLIFSRSPVGQHPAHIIFDLCVMNIDEKEPKIHLLEGASANGHSNYYPHFSPDGKWLSFCQSDGGDLIRTSSDIYLKRGDLSGPSLRLECNVDYAADSWHSWSSNSHWLVFASKRESGIYASLYLTHVGENGYASPAIPLPIPEKPSYSYNIPEFLSNKPGVRETELFEAIRVETKPVEVKRREINKGNQDDMQKGS